MRSYSQLAAVMLLALPLVGWSETAIQIDSELGDPIGIGQNLVITAGDGIAISQAFIDNSVSVITQFDNWRFAFVAPKEIVIEADNYEAAQRFNFQSFLRPGMDAAGGGRGCNSLTGRYVVHEIVYDFAGLVTSLAIDLEQFCDGSLSALSVQIRYDSNVPFDIPEPIAAAGVDQVVLERDEVSFDAANTTGGSGQITDYLWTQLAGTPVTLSDPSAAVVSFSAPSVGGATEVLTFELQVQNSDGLQDTDTIDLSVRDRSQPQTFVSLDSTLPDPIGLGRTWFFDEQNAVFKPERFEATNEVDLRLEDAGSPASPWFFLFVAGDESELQPGDYLDAPKIPFNGNQPGMSASGDGRACSTSVGDFTIFDVAYDPDPIVVNKLALDFVQVCDDLGMLEGEIRLNVILPEANAGDPQQIPERTTATLDASLSTDAEGSVVAYAWTQTAGSAVSLSDDLAVNPEFSYELGDGVTEEDFVFELEVTDEVGYRSRDAVTVTVVQDNAPPAVGDDAETVGQGKTAIIDILANDTDNDGSIVTDTVTLVDAPVQATALISNSTGAITFIPDGEFTGDAVFTYSVEDNDGAVSAPATVTVTVEPGPRAVGDNATTDADVAVSLDLLANDVAAGSPLDPATVSITRFPIGGTLDVAAGVATYTPLPGFGGLDTFEYTVGDTSGDVSAPAIVSVTVIGAATPPPPPPPPPPPAGDDDDPDTDQPFLPVAPGAVPQSDPDDGVNGFGTGAVDPWTLLLGIALYGVASRRRRRGFP